jgi:hypothetical protein
MRYINKEKSTFYLLIFLSFLPGIIVFLYYFDLSIIDPSNTAWIINGGGDLLQHYLGSYAFRVDSWHFPITKTVLLAYPEGVSIVYSDSNPLLSIISKLLVWVFPAHYQFVGVWYLLCWILQSFFGFLIVYKFTRNKIYSFLCGFFFCLFPTQIFRIGHENLIAFWLILWVIYIIISEDIIFKKRIPVFFGVLMLSALIHAYITIMLVFLGGFWLVYRLLSLYNNNLYRDLVNSLLQCFIYSIVFVLFLWIVGYFYNRPEDQGFFGFGMYSMNLLAPFNPFDIVYSNFIRPLPIEEGQYEGFQYFGLGVLLLLLYVTILTLIKYFRKINFVFIVLIISVFAGILYFGFPDLLFFYSVLVIFFFLMLVMISYAAIMNERIFIPLLSAGFVCFFLAVSNKIVIGNFTLIFFPLDENALYTQFFSAIRSSGRFFWVMLHIITLSAFVLLFRISDKSNKVYFVLFSFLFIQLIDLSKVSYRIDSNKKDIIVSDFSNLELVKQSKFINFLGQADMEIVWHALKNNIPVNNFYMAHHSGVLTHNKLLDLRDSFFKNVSDSSALYLFKIEDLPENKMVAVGKHFYKDYFYFNQFEKQHSFLYVNKVKVDSLHFIVNEVSSGSLVILSIKDEGRANLSQFFIQEMDNRYKTNLKELSYRDSYLSIFYRDQLVYEKIGTESFVEYNGVIDGDNLFIKSGASNSGNTSDIFINNIDYSINSRGLNVVSKRIHSDFTVINTTCFDTHMINYPY